MEAQTAPRRAEDAQNGSVEAQKLDLWKVFRPVCASLDELDQGIWGSASKRKVVSETASKKRVGS